MRKFALVSTEAWRVTCLCWCAPVRVQWQIWDPLHAISSSQPSRKYFCVINIWLFRFKVSWTVFFPNLRMSLSDSLHGKTRFVYEYPSIRDNPILNHVVTMSCWATFMSPKHSSDCKWFPCYANIKCRLNITVILNHVATMLFLFCPNIQVIPSDFHAPATLTSNACM